jgi:hypothetical protein
MAIEHDSITDPEIHEPKGISTATSNKVYISDGAGSGDWIPIQAHIGAYIAFDASTPAYQHITTTSNTVLNPTFAVANNTGFTGTTSPNARIIYSGTEDVLAEMSLILSPKQSSGTKKDVEWAIYKNGTEVAGTRCILTTSSSEWKNVSLNSMLELSTNDYIEIFTKANASCTVDYAGAFFTIDATPLAV